MTKNEKLKTMEKSTSARKVIKCDSILGALEEVRRASENSRFEKKVYRKEASAKAAFDYLNDRLGLTDKQCILMAVIAEGGLASWVTDDDIVSHVGCSRLELMQLKPELTSMSMKGLIGYDGKTRFAFPEDVFNAFSKNEVYENNLRTFEDNDDLYVELFNIHNKCDEKEMTVNTLHHITDVLLENNAELPFAKTMLQYKGMLDDDEYRFLIITAVSWLIMYVYNSVYDVRYVFENMSAAKRLAKNLRNNDSALIAKGLMMRVEDGDSDAEDYTLTDRTKKMVKPEWSGSSSCKDKNLFPAAKIVSKSLFYNKETARQISDLYTLLDEEHFQSVMERMKERNLRCAFTCLFHGGPGTGKTETAYQLARKTGRDIYQVDYSELRSKWIGESEKNVKSMFDEYRTLCKGSGLVPIFLLNEADALIGKRLEVEHGSDKGENTMQNIILQEMETLEGILIATTNLTVNMDRAFERRFLYKVRFDNPDTEVRTKIWRSMLPSLNKQDASILSDKFPLFAGGQIENVTRKVTVDEVLYGRKTQLGDIVTLCEHETLDAQTRQKNTIGFTLK